MAIGTTLFIVGVLVAAVWIVIEMKRFRHKVFAIALIALILFTYFSFTSVLNRNEIDLDSTQSLISAGKLYFSWLGTVFGNFRTITANAINLDWSGGNKTLEKNK